MRVLKLRESNFGVLRGLIMCLACLIMATNSTVGQVVIVPSKLRAARVNSKVKSKPKSKKDVIPSPTPEPEPASDPTPKMLAFAVIAPPLLKEAATPVVEPNVAAPVRLLTYGFDVITADERGKVVRSRVQQARYFIEGLNAEAPLEMVEVPGGMFSMGITDEEAGQIIKEHERGIKKEMRESLLDRLRWETPQHAVKLPAFYVSKYEITQAQWRAVANLPRVRRDLMSDPSHFKGDNRPVDSVSWEDAVEFCERLSRASGRQYRLPTEAEWEYACRAGTMSPFHFGEAITSAWANYHGRYPYAAAPKGPGRDETLPAGSLGAANAFGLYDMHGNVWEWCLDSWHDNYYSSPADGRAWEEQGTAYLKVLRGGAWDSSAGECRTSSRNRITLSLRLNNVGFRVVTE
jgi:formylglycine-generating enzyme required for sulfatase activity